MEDECRGQDGARRCVVHGKAGRCMSERQTGVMDVSVWRNVRLMGRHAEAGQEQTGLEVVKVSRTSDVGRGFVRLLICSFLQRHTDLSCRIHDTLQWQPLASSGRA